MASNKRVALITGVGRHNGIGAAIARAFAGNNIALALTYHPTYDTTLYGIHHQHDPTELAQSLQADGAEVVVSAANLADIHTPAQLVEQTLTHYGRLDILINNAAHSVDASIHDLTPALLDDHWAVNGRAMMLLCAAFVQAWQHHPTHQAGRIINMTSGQGLSPMAGNLAYAATKGVVDAFTISLSAEVMGLGITVNAVDPGATDSGWMSDDLKAELTQQFPTGRIGLPSDAAQLVQWLASPQAGWVTGQIIRSRGGLW